MGVSYFAGWRHFFRLGRLELHRWLLLYLCHYFDARVRGLFPYSSLRAVIAVPLALASIGFNVYYFNILSVVMFGHTPFDPTSVGQPHVTMYVYMQNLLKEDNDKPTEEEELHEFMVVQ